MGTHEPLNLRKDAFLRLLDILLAARDRDVRRTNRPLLLRLAVSSTRFLFWLIGEVELYAERITELVDACAAGADDAAYVVAADIELEALQRRYPDQFPHIL